MVYVAPPGRPWHLIGSRMGSRPHGGAVCSKIPEWKGTRPEAAWHDPARGACRAAFHLAQPLLAHLAMSQNDDPARTRHQPSTDSPFGAPARGREPIFNFPPVIAAFIALCVGIHAMRMWVLSPAQDLAVLHFAFFPLQYSGGYPLDIYAIVAPVTYSLLHGNVAHLAVNMIWLAAFGSPLANRIGALRFVLFWIVASLAAVGLHYLLYKSSPVPLIGASGAIAGMMGAAARFGFHIDRSSGRPAFGGPILSIPAVFTSRMAVAFLVVWFVVNLVMGVGFGTSDDGSSIAWEAHIGGFLAGFLLIRAFDVRPLSRP